MAITDTTTTTIIIIMVTNVPYQELTLYLTESA
jgi:hypothetical protein